MEDFIATNLANPTLVVWSFLLIRSRPNLKSSKSLRFLVIKGYLLKWGIITLVKSLIDLTE